MGNCALCDGKRALELYESDAESAALLDGALAADLYIEHEDDGGIFLGAGWVVLPIFPGGKTRTRTQLFGDETFGLTTWTHVIDTAQYSGPLLAYASGVRHT